MISLEDGKQVEGNMIRPSHYNYSGLEPKDVIRAFGINFNIGNSIKYIIRAGKKGSAKQDIQKAMQYIDFELEYMEKYHDKPNMNFSGYKEFQVDECIRIWDLNEMLRCAVERIFAAYSGATNNYYTENLLVAKDFLSMYLQINC